MCKELVKQCFRRQRIGSKIHKTGIKTYRGAYTINTRTAYSINKYKGQVITQNSTQHANEKHALLLYTKAHLKRRGKKKKKR